MEQDELLSRAGETLGTALELVEAVNPPGRRTQVLRCRAGRESVIVKLGTDAREHDALALLSDTGIAPRLLAADETRLLVIMEDLPGQPVDEILQSSNAAAAEVALVAFARTFGALHRHTARDGPTLTIDAGRIVGLWGMDVEEAMSVRANALTQIDVGPDGCMIADGSARLFDFEFAEDGAALTDVVLWRMGFPNCGASAGAIPESVLLRMMEAYGPIDPADFGRAYTWMLLQRLDRYHAWKVLDEDWVWAHASGRQRVLFMLRQCPETAPLAEQFSRLHDRLRRDWPDTPDSLPTYPAFRSGPD